MSISEHSEDRPSSPGCKGCVFPGNCPCFDKEESMSLHYQDAMVAVYRGDCLEVMRTLPDNSVDSIVTDPPYGIGFMGKAWDKLPPGEDWAIECLRVLKPGGHLLAFGGTRTWHRLAVAVEDAGFEIRDSIAWMYSSGFPKSMDVAKAMDKERAEDRAPSLAITRQIEARRLELGLSREDVNFALCGTRHRGLPAQGYLVTKERGLTRPVVPHAKHWAILQDLLGWGDHLGDEVVRLNGRKGTSGADWAKREIVGVSTSGSGSGSMVGLGSTRTMDKTFERTAPASEASRQWEGWGTALKPAFEPIIVARKGMKNKTLTANLKQHRTGALNIEATRIGDRWPANVALDESQAERLRDSRYFFVAKAPKRERPEAEGVSHPTVKPLELMRWLVRLVTPEGGTVLDPFVGSGTTIEAASLEGFQSIGIEREAEYLPLILARIERSAA